MDKNKKIIVGAVGFLMAGILFFIITNMYSNDTKEPEIGGGFDFVTPEVDLAKIDNSTKKELYDAKETDFDEKPYDSLANNLTFLQKMKQKFMEDTTDMNQMQEGELTEDEEAEYVNSQLEMLQMMQSQMAQSEAGNSQYAPRSAPRSAPRAQRTVAKKAKKAPEKPVKELPKTGAFFFGAASNEKDHGENLIPAEVIDQGIQKQGSLVAIRTKKHMIIPGSGIRIPKGAVIYGVATINENRLLININKYKRNNRLFNIDINVHDFDGREGIHLKNKSIFKIPSNVSRKVSRAVLQRYSSQPGFGGSNTIEMKDVGNVAAITAADEIAQEIFDKRRVFLPRKYHLWLTFNNDSNGK